MTKSWNDIIELENQEVISRNNLMLVDANNLAFRFLMRDNVDSFQDEFISTVSSLGKSYQAKKTILCFDFGKSYYRKNLLDGYKGNRTKPDDDESVKRFENFYNCLNTIPEIAPFDFVKKRGVEADDIIAFFVDHISHKYDHTWIISSDRDLYQLLDDNVSIFNIFSRREITDESLFVNTGLLPNEYLLSRIIEGDTSDNIRGIEGIGPKRSAALVKKYETLDNLIKAMPIPGKAKYIQNLNAGKDLLILNEQLISLLKYNEEIIRSGKNGDIVWNELLGKV